MSLRDDTIAAFQRRFGERPQFVAAAPGRVNLIGEHTDYNDGFVLPIAIDRETVIAASPSSDLDRSTLVALDLNAEHIADLTVRLEPIPRPHSAFFANYVLGVVDQLAQRGWRMPNLDMVVRSTIPVGAGLSSSASVEVATATLLEHVTGRGLDTMEKVRLCQAAEHAFPGTPCGIMDMFISSRGEWGRAMFLDCRTLETRAVPLPPESAMTLLVVDTGVRHTLAGGEYARRREQCRSAAARLGVSALRDATLEMVKRAELSELERARALHVVTENDRVLHAVEALARGDVEAFCLDMVESHHSLRDRYEVSCVELNAVVDAAMEFASETADPFIGARMTGGGFGGCAIVFARTSMTNVIADRVRTQFHERFGREPVIFPVRASPGARRIDLS